MASSNASVTTSTSNLSRDERAKIIREKRSAASASIPKTPPREVIGNLSSATNDATSPYEDDHDDVEQLFDDDGETPLATICEDSDTDASAKHGDDDDDEEEEDEDADDHEDKDDAADGYGDDANFLDDGAEEDDIIYELRKSTADPLPLRQGEW